MCTTFQDACVMDCCFLGENNDGTTGYGCHYIKEASERCTMNKTIMETQLDTYKVRLFKLPIVILIHLVPLFASRFFFIHIIDSPCSNLPPRRLWWLPLENCLREHLASARTAVVTAAQNISHAASNYQCYRSA